MSLRQCACNLSALTFVFALLLAPSGARAFHYPCEFAGGVLFAPFHPVAWETIRFSAGYDRYAIVAPIVLSKVRQLGGRQLELDIVFTDDRTRFPAYAVAEIGPDFDVHGVLGSLPVGDYAVTVGVYVDNTATGTLDLSCGTTMKTLDVYDTPGIAPVVEYYHRGLDQYFITQDANEIGILDAGVLPGWTRTGESFLAYQPGQTNGRLFAIARFYRSNGEGTHFYTVADWPEAEAIRRGFFGEWLVETPDAFELFNIADSHGDCASGTIPLYRLWKPGTANHRYTVDAKTRAGMIAQGYVSEGQGGVFMCAVAP